MGRTYSRHAIKEGIWNFVGKTRRKKETTKRTLPKVGIILN
jgi:hypothetical protein